MSNPTLIYSVMSKGQAPKLYTELTNVKGARVVNNYDGTNKEIGRLIETTLFIPKGTTLAFAVPKGVGVRVSRPILNADGSEGGTDRKIVKHQIDDEHYCIIVAEQDGTSTTSITSRSGVMYMLIHLEDAVPTIGVNNVLSLLGFYSSGSREESQHLFLEHNTDFLKLGTSLSDATNDLPVELWYNEQWVCTFQRTVQRGTCYYSCLSWPPQSCSYNHTRVLKIEDSTYVHKRLASWYQTTSPHPTWGEVSGLCCAFDGDSSSDCNVVCNGVMSQDPIIVALGGVPTAGGVKKVLASNNHGTSHALFGWQEIRPAESKETSPVGSRIGATVNGQLIYHKDTTYGGRGCCLSLVKCKGNKYTPGWSICSYADHFLEPPSDCWGFVSFPVPGGMAILNLPRILVFVAAFFAVNNGYFHMTTAAAVAGTVAVMMKTLISEPTINKWKHLFVTNAACCNDLLALHNRECERAFKPGELSREGLCARLGVYP
ncbi:predicted protein [Phaeodactylum tricornutum CCAP 1055/1]|uniref:Uncharacterized protein n=3 Tax=Phaeodactylum tricornutum TaxID=2850 RepID=B7G6M1_PHATC|nr:predicted protein [Phaeodactylum tricornutum CCAP 1055/1]EEC45881.1 predicted protein [Phaeodactylum tricornutum CCAP 1055/1]|eukprot:XP_002182594.1 predicted protein [Phaeodactylum tricornutum CCAP 1055/1]